VRKTSKISAIFGLLAIVGFAGGCTIQDGIRDGLNDGISAALAYLIEAPVTAAVDNALGAGD
jgi:hypothetical protein